MVNYFPNKNVYGTRKLFLEMCVCVLNTNASVLLIVGPNCTLAVSWLGGIDGPEPQPATRVSCDFHESDKKFFDVGVPPSAN